MNFTQLMAFRAVAEAGSFTRAAEREMVSQPALSKHVIELERKLGVPLFHRDRKKLSLSEAGTLLYDHATRIAALMNQAEQAVADLSHLRRGRVRIGATPTLGTYFLPKTLVYFRQRFPEIVLEFRVDTSAILMQSLRDGALDAVVSSVAPAEDDLNAMPLMAMPFVPVVAADHELARSRQVKRADLIPCSAITREPRSSDRSFVDVALDKAGLAAMPRLSFSTTEAMKQAALAGLGVAMMPEITVRAEIDSGKLIQLPLKGLSGRQPVYWIERATVTRSKACQAYWCVVEHAACGKLPPPPGGPDASKRRR